MNLSEMTAEQKQAMVLKSQATRAANAAARKASTLRNDFADMSYWEDMARERGLRLPPPGQPCTVSRMRTFLHKAGFSQADYEYHYGKLAGFPANNPDWPMRAWAGTVLEIEVDKSIRPYGTLQEVPPLSNTTEADKRKGALAV